MLEKTPAALGHALEGARAGLDKLIWADAQTAAPETIVVESPAFQDQGVLPARYTADGEGASPPLSWSGGPATAKAVVLVVEDADSPTPAPIVHTLAYGLGPGEQVLAEGALKPEAASALGLGLGKNSFRKAGWLPPDPPTGHGPHRYVFQVYALDRAPDLSGEPEKHHVLEAMRGHVVARGRLIGTYQRPG